MYLICSTGIPFFVSHTPIQYYNISLLQFFFTIIQLPLIIKSNLHYRVSVCPEIKTRHYMRKPWEPECRQLCVPDVIIQRQLTTLQSAYWLARNCGHTEKVRPEYIPNGIFKTTMQKVLVLPRYSGNI